MKSENDRRIDIILYIVILLGFILCIGSLLVIWGKKHEPIQNPIDTPNQYSAVIAQQEA